MGVNWHQFKALLSAHKAGVRFDQTMTIGRLNLFVSEFELKQLLAAYPDALANYDKFLKPHPVYAEGVFKLLGATQVDSLDASDYEKATVIHDLNQPIPDALKGKYDFVNDGGTLEHVFNFPTAVKNCMELLKVGGSLLINTPANNNFGHGFYQFSPELFYRVLCPDNGFKVERMIVHEEFDGSQWYEVADPDEVRSRVELSNFGTPVMLSIRARRTHDAPIFAKYPQQSDYVTVWNANQGTDTKNTFLEKPSGLRVGLKKTLASLSPELMHTMRRRKSQKLSRSRSFDQQRKFFKPVAD